MQNIQSKTKQTPKEYFSPADYEWLCKVASYDSDDPQRFVFADDGKVAEKCALYACDLLEGDFYFLRELELGSNYAMLSAEVPEFGRTLLLCLRYCIDVWESPDAARWLGFLHQIGRFVKKDAREAVRLYQFAEQRGDLQSAINLGYIYEYGHLGHPDYEAAFKQFVKVVSLGNYPEALYKMGDAYARAHVVERDMRTAYNLYKKCYETSGDLIGVRAQAAFRLAELLIDNSNEQWDIPYDPVMALHFYSVAELGIRIQLAADAPWYKERLQQAIEGQGKARELMDAMGANLARRRRMSLP